MESGSSKETDIFISVKLCSDSTHPEYLEQKIINRPKTSFFGLPENSIQFKNRRTSTHNVGSSPILLASYEWLEQADPVWTLKKMFFYYFEDYKKYALIGIMYIVNIHSYKKMPKRKKSDILKVLKDKEVHE